MMPRIAAVIVFSAPLRIAFTGAVTGMDTTRRTFLSHPNVIASHPSAESPARFAATSAAASRLIPTVPAARVALHARGVDIQLVRDRAGFRPATFVLTDAEHQMPQI